ncbi:Uncharacterized protein TCM_009163 [Theobroma cacao]|uniref:Uncharacterized protein n=1 Tax=Theobroma cacao TaxID=3641 RepID=A0A061E5S1_THECC|nr:Uncharacterized protein TCM_009163 [Theobroma cacao]
MSGPTLDTVRSHMVANQRRIRSRSRQKSLTEKQITHVPKQQVENRSCRCHNNGRRIRSSTAVNSRCGHHPE